MLQNKFEASLLCGAIGDAWGSSFENEPVTGDTRTFYLGAANRPNPGAGRLPTIRS